MAIGTDHVKGMTSRAFYEGAYEGPAGREQVSVYMYSFPLKGGHELRIGPNRYKIENDSYLVFVDLMHDANFTHPVRYELHNVNDGSVRSIEEEFPIADPEIERKLTPVIVRGKEVK